MSAAITAAVIGGGALVYSATQSANASKSAANTQAAAADRATNAQAAALEQQNLLSAPYRASGEAAQNRLMQYLGIKPSAGAAGAPTSAPEQTLENFDTNAYLAANPDVKAAIGKRGVESAWAHYLNYGQSEGRQFTFKPEVQAAAKQAAEDYTNSPDFGKYASAEFGGVPGFDQSTLFKDFQGVEGFDPSTLFKDFQGVEGFDPASLMKNFSEEDFKADPGYAFRLKEGLKSLNATAAARGGLISGNALRAGQDYGQDLASQEYANAFNRYQANRASQGQEYGNAYNRFANSQAFKGQEYGNAYNRFANNRAFLGQEYGNAFNRFQTERANTLSPLQALAGQGQAAAAGQAANVGNFGAQQAANITGAANAQAAGQIGAANAYSNAIGQGIGMYQTNQLLNRFAPTQGQSSYGSGSNSGYGSTSNYGTGWGSYGNTAAPAPATDLNNFYG